MHRSGYAHRTQTKHSPAVGYTWPGSWLFVCVPYARGLVSTCRHMALMSFRDKLDGRRQVFLQLGTLLLRHGFGRTNPVAPASGHEPSEHCFLFALRRSLVSAHPADQRLGPAGSRLEQGLDSRIEPAECPCYIPRFNS